VLPGENGGTSTVRVPLSVQDFEEVHRLVAAVWRARSEGVEPRVCSCNVCAGRPEVIAAAAARRDLTMVFGISSVFASALEDLGCRRHEDLAALDPVATVAAFRTRRLFISPGVIKRWQLHARAYAEGRPVLLKGRKPLPNLGRYIALDLEWDLDGKIWLIGAGRRHRQQGPQRLPVVG
jgi:predicted RecB family nuclease